MLNSYYNNRYRNLLICMICFSLFNTSLLFSSVTKYTPEGQSFTALEPSEFTSGQIEDINELGDDYVIDNDLDATRIGNASNTYNCHGYAWLKSEGGSTVWINTPDDDKFWSDGAYSNDSNPSYASCSSSIATHVSYSGTDHSVRKIQNSYPVATSGNQNCVSKWGAWGLYRHELGDDPYNETGYNYYILKKTHSGTLSSYPKTWVGAGDQTHTLAADVTVSSGESLTIQPDVTVELAASKKITVNGTLIANGTSGNRITFDKSGASDWWGIRFNDSSDDDGCSLTYCTIENAEYPVYCATSDPYIANCIIQNCALGIYLYYPNSDGNNINNNTISTMSAYGIWQAYGDASVHSNDISYANRGFRLDNGDGKIQGNTIHHHNWEGIKLDGSDHTITDNLIYSNSQNGIYCYDYSDPYFRFAYHGNNVIRDNTQNGVKIDATSLPDMSAYSAVAASAHSLYDNGASYDEVYSLQSSTVKAEYNYWGESPPDAGRFYGNVDYYPSRSTDPNKLIPLPPALSPDSSPLDQLITQDLPSNADAHKIFYEGYLLQGEEKYDEALVNFKTVIANYPESFEAMMALSRIRKCLKQAERLSELESYLSSIYKPNKDRLLGAKVLEMQIPVLVRNKSFNSALANCATIVKDFPESEMAKGALHNTWLIHYNNMEDLGAAKTAMDLYGSKFSNDEDHVLMKLAMGEITSDQAKDLMNALSKSIASNSENELPVSFELSDNYPNPFNPETKIQIGLPKDSDVKLQIFNIRGQVVATPFEGNLPAGSHTVNFNASALSSGVYFYKIIAGEFSDVKRMVLVK